MTARVAVYYAPALDDPLWTAGCAWLGRNPQTGQRINHPSREVMTREPAKYGFHATLKPPMRLAHRWTDLVEDATALAEAAAPFELPALRVTDLDGFLALQECTPCPPLHVLADACVTELDIHRQPAEPAELARRRQAGLTAEQDTLLLDWGYPYVLRQWRFHMTLTRRLTPEERATVQPAAEAHFAASLAQLRQVKDICLFTQVAPGSAFVVAERLALCG